jgi:hypothetical protein
MVRLAQQQQLSSSAARVSNCVALVHLYKLVHQLLCCWHVMLGQGSALLRVVVRTLLPLVQQLQGCGSLLMTPAAARSAPAAGVQAGGSSVLQMQNLLFVMQQSASVLVNALDAYKPLDAGVAAEVLRLQNDPAVAEMQLQLLTAATALLHKQHTAQQLQQQQLPPGTAGACSSSTQQQQQQPAKQQQHRADLLSIPAFHQDMLPLLPGGQAYLDAAAEEAAGWGLSGADNTPRLCKYLGICCSTISLYLLRNLQSTAGQQQISRNALVVSGAAVRLVLELQLLASGAVQRQRELYRQQQQRQQAVTCEGLTIIENFALQTWDLLRLQVRALAATSRSCLPPEVLQQAGLQLLQALAAPLQQWQLSRVSSSVLQNAAVADAERQFGDTLQVLMTAACGAQPTPSGAPCGEHGNAYCRCQQRIP